MYTWVSSGYTPNLTYLHVQLTLALGLYFSGNFFSIPATKWLNASAPTFDKLP